MAEGSLVYRPNLAQLTWIREASFNAAAGEGAQVTPFGVIDEDVRLPDPEINYFAHPNLGEGADVSVVAPGARSLSGSIPFLPQNGKILAMMLGAVADTGTDVAAGGGSDLDGATAVDATEVTLTAVTDYAENDYIQIDTGAKAEIRKITAINLTVLTLDKKLLIAHADEATCNEVATPYTHAITASQILPSMCIEAAMNDGTADAVRYFRGVKISGGRLSAEEEGELKASIDIEAAYAEASSQTKSTLVPVTTKPYSFHQGACTFWGTTFARVLNWSIDVKRSMKPRRYIQSTNGAFPYEINEGLRNIELSATIVAADDIGSGNHGTEAMKELLTPTAAGFDISLLLTRGASDTITISNPTAKKCHLKSAPHPLTKAEDSPIAISVMMKGIEVSIVDAIPYYPVV
jgi:hypothetical protein